MLDEEMDHMDQMIREAANNHHPAYNDKAWEKMELQLDKHLPQKKDRRRLIFFLLFFVLLGAGTFFVWNNKMGSDDTNASEKNIDKKKENASSATEYTAQNASVLKEDAQASENTKAADKNQTSVVTENEDKAKAITGNKLKPQNGDIRNKNAYADRLINNNDKPAANTKQTATNNFKPQNNSTKGRNNFANRLNNNNDEPNTNNKQITTVKPRLQKADNRNNYNNADVVSSDKDELISSGTKRTGNKSKTKTRITAANPTEDVQNSEALANKKKPIAGKTASKTKVTVAAPAVTNDENAFTASIPAGEKKEKNVAVEEIKADKEPVKDSLKPAVDKKLVAVNKKPDPSPDKKKQKNKAGNNFGLTFSVGPDVSFVKLNNIGKTTLTYGAGISYGFGKRFTARTGFYVSKKVYEALPDQYHTPGGNYPYLTDVDAKCNIYEIPVSLSYSFGQRKNHNWFGSVGLSSFIMKKEDYVYNYKTPTGQTYDYYYTARNQNKHYFSVLNLSGGYQYQFNKWLSIEAEPYLQIPLGGVGMGKIKLNSAGVLFTVTVKPFAKKK
jgi:hypothetical protein